MKDGENLMLSPLSISLALSMTLNGAETTTKTDMINTMGFKGFSVDEINQIYLDLITALKKSDPKVVMNVANSIWIKKNYPVLEPFITTNQKYYDARIEKLEFDLNALKAINGWVNEKTNTKIPEILDKITGDEIMFLINAIYFKGQWKIQLDKSKTQDESFSLASGGTVTVPMMKVQEQFGYSVQTGFKALKMPYGRGKFGMTILLPEDGKTPDQLMSQLTPSMWAAIENSLKTTVKTDVWLPRFKFNYGCNLEELLSSMGMSVAFTSGQADFSKINTIDDLYITKAIHKTFIEVNEEGTEAAAATLIAIGKTSAGPSEPVFHATKPFLFFITEEDTNAILFVGKVENPLIVN
jgi:serpin B